MKKLFIDTNILIDFLTQKKPFDFQAGKIFSLAEQNLISCGVSSLSIANTHYHLLKLMNPNAVNELLRRFKILLKVHPLDEKLIDLGLNSSDFSDFEDSLQYFTALEFGYDGIITRNQKDFKKSSLPILAPEQFLEIFKKKEL
jgi:predicted nucleic acid-binding protein